MNRSTHRGFTLIELLVVVTIIIALLAILLPSMGRAIHVAQMTQCLTNQKQAGTGMLSFAADNYGKFEQYGFGKPTDMKRGSVDAREDLAKYVAFNELACPFTEKINYIDPPVTTGIIEWTYAWFAGWQFAFEDDGMIRPGDTFKQGNRRFSLLIADQLWTPVDGSNPHASHPGRGMGLKTSGGNTGSYIPEINYGTAYTFIRWQNPSVSFASGGETDLNFLFTDLSGRMVNNISFNDRDQVEPVSFFRQPNGWNLWVPTSQ